MSCDNHNFVRDTESASVDDIYEKNLVQIRICDDCGKKQELTSRGWQ